MALYNTDDIYIIKDMVQIDLLKYTLPNEPGNDNLYFNQIGHKVICMQVKTIPSSYIIWNYMNK